MSHPGAQTAQPALRSALLLLGPLVASSCGGSPAAPPLYRPATASTEVASAAPVPPPSAVQLSSVVEPVAYDLELSIDPATPRFSGEARIDVEVKEATSVVVLHGRDLVIHQAAVEVGSRTLAARVSSRPAFGARDARGELVVETEETIPPGPARLVFRWDAPYAALWGPYRTQVGDRSFVFTQMEPIDARRAFPSFDEPRFKTPFTVAIEAPAGMWVGSNGAPALVEPQAGGMVRHAFVTTPPIPTYLVAFAVGPLERIRGSDDTSGLVALQGRAAEGKESLAAAELVLAEQQAWFGHPYAYGKLDLVAVPDFGPGAMENPGLVTFRDELLLLGDEPPAALRRSMRGIVAHELAHQWFGNLVTMRWWDDLWLNEAFATWMAPRTCDAVFPGMNAVDDRVMYEARAVAGDMLPSARAVRPAITTEDAIHEAGGWSAYLKGSTVLAMVERWVGAPAFQRGVRSYISADAHGSATAHDLVRALEAAAPGKPVGAVLSSFVDQPGVPLVDARLHCKTEPKASHPAELVLRVEPLRVADPGFAGIAAPRWTIPVCARVAGEGEPRCALARSGETVALELARCPAWIHPDAGEVGYYRWTLDDASWGKLLASASQLTPAERAGLVLGAWSLVQAERSGVDRVVGALRALQLRKDEPRVVVEAVITVLREMDASLVDDATRPAFRGLVDEVLGRVAVPEPRLPRTTAGDEQRLLRVALLGARYDLAPGAASALGLARARVGQPDPDLAALLLRVDAHAGQGAALALATEQGFVAATRDRPSADRVAALTAMGSFADPIRLRAALDVVLTPSFRAGDFRHVRAAALRTPATRPVFLQWMTDRFEPLVRKLGGASSLTAAIGGVCDAAELARLEAFFTPKVDALEGARRGWDEGRAGARRCIGLRTRIGPSLSAALARR